MTIWWRASPAQQVPATGISIGVSRLMSALGLARPRIAIRVAACRGHRVSTRPEAAASFAIVQEIARRRSARPKPMSAMAKMGDQFKYADKRGAAIAVIEGGRRGGPAVKSP